MSTTAIMFPYCPLPRHITALYVMAVASSLALFSHSINFVGADIIVFSNDSYQIYDFQDMPAHFGDSFPPDGLEAYFVYANPKNACSELRPPPPGVANPTGHWVVLIMRGSCSFEDKIRMAQKSNYDAAIIHNVGSDNLEIMSANNATGIRIPSMFVGEHTGLILDANYQYDNGYFIILDGRKPLMFPPLLPLFLAVVVICFLIMFGFMLYKCVQDRRRQRRHRLPSSSLQQIPTSKFKRSDPYETCAICLEDYQEGEKIRILPCHHVYHCKCIDPWLTRNRRVCPVCKRKVFAQDEHISDLDSDSSDDVDDRTPLVRPGTQGTQGGTFRPPVGNPFLISSSTSSPPSSSSSSSSVPSISDTSSFSNALEDGSAAPDNNKEPVSRTSKTKHSRKHHHQSSECDKSTPAQNCQCKAASRQSRNDSLDSGNGVQDADVQSQNTLGCYNMSSGEHSINSRPTDLEFSNDHFENASSQWGSREALLGSQGEASAVAPAEVVEESQSPTDAQVPDVQVHSSSTQDSDNCSIV